MKNLFYLNIKFWHLILLAFIIILANKILPIEAAAPFFQGDISINQITDNTPLQIFVGDTETTHMTASFTVPSGATADVAVFYNLNHEYTTFGGCRSELRLDSPTGNVIGAGELEFGSGGYGNINSQTINAVATNVSAGNHVIYATAEPSGSPNIGELACTLSKGSITLIIKSK